MPTIAYLIRHAQSRQSSRLRDAEWPLSSVGVEQADQLVPLLEPLQIAKLYSSPYVRCLHTIEPFAKRFNLNVHIRDDLRERSISRGLRVDFREIWHRSWQDFLFALPECESSRVACDRFVRAVRQIVMEETGVVGVCAHGNVIGLLLNHLYSGFGREETDRLRNPDVVKLVVNGDGLVWDDTFRLSGLHDIATDHQDTPVDW